MLNISSWLKSGALIYLCDNRYLLGCELINEVEKPSSEPSFYAPDFYLSKPRPWHIYKQNVELSKSELISFLNKLTLTKIQVLAHSYNWQMPNQNQFNGYFDQIQKLIAIKELEKLVPVVFETSNLKMNELLLAHKLVKLLNNVEGQNIYGHWDQGEGILGVSPELFIEFENNSLTTMALAGTGLTSDEENSLLSDIKELHEHSLVVSNIVEVMERFGKINTSETYEWKLDPLKHLRTDIYVMINNKKFTVTDLLHLLHPTAALGVYPKSFDWKKIKNFETDDRKYFGAPFGVSFNNRFRSIVSIRNIQWDECGIKIGSGCGIVGKSDKLKEWGELANKRSSVKKYLGIIND